MKKSTDSKRKGFSDAEDDEHLITIISNLFKELEAVDEGKYWSRVVNKFREKKIAKK